MTNNPSHLTIETVETAGPSSEPSAPERLRDRELWEYRTAALRDAARIAELEGEVARFYEKVNGERTGNTVFDLLRIAETRIGRLEVDIRAALDERDAAIGLAESMRRNRERGC